MFQFVPNSYCCCLNVISQVSGPAGFTVAYIRSESKEMSGNTVFLKVFSGICLHVFLKNPETAK